MNVVICWTNISGYIAAGWRALAGQEGINLSILAFASDTVWEADFSKEVVTDLRCELLDESRRNDAAYIRERVIACKPDVVVVPGWLHPPYVALAHEPALAGAKLMMGMDTPWNGGLRQRLGRVKVGKFLDRMDTVIVAGERAFQLARVLRVPEHKILRGMYGYDDAPLADLHGKRSALAGGWPRAFLYAGRYVSDKAVDVLLAGYAKYRAAVSEPWPLNCCGKGPLQSTVAAAEGVNDLGFLQPGQMPDVFLRHGVSLLVSRFEPWGVALAEAMAAGLPVICTEACGASVELVRHLHNGLVIPTDDADRTADAMKWMHAHHADLPAMGSRAREYAVAHTAERWAQRWAERIDR